MLRVTRLLLWTYLSLNSSFVVSVTFSEIESLVRVVNSVNLSTPALIEYIAQLPIKYNTNDCLRDLKEVLNGTVELEPWALSMLGAGTKIPLGLLEENQRDLGKFDQCVEVKRKHFFGQHCLITVVLGLDVPSGTKTEEENFVVVKASSVAACFPSTCESPVMSQAYNFGFSDINADELPENLKLTAFIQDVDCHTKYKSRLGTGDWIVTALLLVILLMSVVGTVWHIRVKQTQALRPQTEERSPLQYFSVITSGCKLLDMKPNPEDLKSLHGIRFISVAWVLLCHKYFFSTSIQPLLNPYRKLQMIGEWTKLIILNGSLAVDSFLLLSGLLNAYCFFCLVERKKSLSFRDVLKSYFYRYLRISAPYFIIIAITATLLYHLGSGPIWGRVVGDARQVCRDYWWTNVIYLNNYLTPRGSCVIQSWYLAVDMQLFWLAPLLLVPLWKWGAFGIFELLLLSILCTVAPFIISFVYEIRTPVPISNNLEANNLQMAVLYLPTHTRAIAYICGVFLGQLLFKIKTEKMDFELTKVKFSLGWLVAAFCLLYPIFGSYDFFQPANDVSQVSISLYLALFRLFWSIGLAWVILTCETGYGGLLSKFLSLRVFIPLSRLTYCIFLTHVAYLTVRTGLLRSEYYLHDFFIVEEYLGDLVIVILLSALLYLLVEAPVMSLIKQFLRGERETEDKDLDDTDNEGESFSGRFKLNLFKSTP